MSSPPPNPYHPPQGVSPPGAGDGFAGMRYVEAYTYVFDHPNWLMSLLLATVCQLIPIVGPIVLMGYQFEVIEALHRRTGPTYPDFRFELFVDYLKRGIWPFLVSLIVGAVLALPLTLLMYVLMIIVVVAAHAVGEGAGAVVVVFGFLVGGVCWLAAVVAMTLAIVPMFLRAGLAQDFAEGFKFDFVADFVRRTWKEMALSALFMCFTGLLVGVIGMALCCIGVYFSATLILLAYAHIYYQLYQAYLSRGGSPIPLQQPAAP